MDIKGLINSLLDLIYPRKCTFCRRIMDEQPGYTCPDCREKLPYNFDKPLRTKRGLTCYAPLIYKDEVKAALRRYKFGNLPAYSRTFGELMAEHIAESNACFDVITWVPLGRKKLRKRGYDQALLLAQVVGEKSGRPVEGLLKKTGSNSTQSLITDPNKRRENVSGVYSLKKGAAVEGRRILLIDDIVTTGSTLSECVGVLEAAGAGSVVCLAAATASRDGKLI